MKTLKVQDLMVGDWVVTELGCVIIQLKVDDFKQIECNELIVNPIPLTEEILAMNGWKDSDPNLFNGLHYVFIYGKNHTLTLNHWTNSNTNEEYYTFAIGGGDRILKYVHELQRALRCCGLFDLADNFKVAADGVKTNTSTQNITD
ncbi:MAG: hypothetical protein MJZ34_16740 [Paludibacteraceae bacterium]|nr:hypothetical protein [Paludibacteraceae bacterium]